MKNNIYLIILMILVVSIILYSSNTILKLQDEVNELEERQTQLILYAQSCNTSNQDNENSIILNIDEAEDYCKTLLNQT